MDLATGSHQGRTGEVFEVASAQGIEWALLTTAVFIAVLSPPLVRAGRFIFPVYFIMGSVGVVAAIRVAPSVHRLAARAAEYPWLPASVWMVTFLLSLGSNLVRL